MTQTKPFGSWQSPISSDLIVSGTIKLGAVVIDQKDIYWLEGRPSEGGRYVLVRQTPDGQVADITPEGFNVRTRVHEYGGGAFLVTNNVVYFSNDSDQRLYQQVIGGTPQPLTREAKLRYADLILDQGRDRVICVCEDHTNPNREPINTLVSISLSTGATQVIASGQDFYASPRLSRDGKQLAWVSWNHPHLPWDAAELWLADLAEAGTLETPTKIAGGIDQSVMQPEWSPTGELYFVDERTGWWNLYRRTLPGEIEAVTDIPAEFGYPHWVFGLSNYTIISATEILCSYSQGGSWHLARLDTENKTLQPLEIPFSEIASVHGTPETLVFIGGSPTEPTAVVQMDIKAETIKILKQTTKLEIDKGYLSTPESIEFPTENNQTAYAWYYPPKNKDYTPPVGTAPPLIVKSHGGPTAAASPSFSLKLQYWTSRGFAVLDVNYGGSIGYGQEYRQRLDRNWGIVDVQDCVNGAKYLVQQGKVDPDKLAITGGSAGGYTTLAALTFTDTFKVGASYYGVSDLETLATDTHKFESRYLDRLVGEYPEEKDVYKARSPIHFTDRLSCPAIFLQGLEDRIVPPSQAEAMVNSLKTKGLPVAYVPFEGEQHGFRRSENIKRALEAEYYFYAQIFGLEIPEKIEPVEILNF
jgi:dipeptidyl aminopeptidase/acylaminoacyl peptidase